MAENDQNNDEYKFAELDSLENESMENTNFSSGSTDAPKGPGGTGEKANVKRNALIAVGVVVFAMLMYKFIGGMFSGKSVPVTPKESPTTPAPITETMPSPQPIQTEIPQQPIPTQLSLLVLVLYAPSIH